MQEESLWIASLLGTFKASDGAFAAAGLPPPANLGGQDDVVVLDKTAAEFGWRVSVVSSLAELARVFSREGVIAALFNPDELGEAAEQFNGIFRANPTVRPIVCTSPASVLREPLPHAYSSLMLPLDMGEVRQTLGFLWATLSASSDRKSPKGAPVVVRTAA